MSLGATIREARKAKGLNQLEVAEKLGISVQAVSQWERDKTAPDASNLIKLSRLLDMSLDSSIKVRDMLVHLGAGLGQSDVQPVKAQMVYWTVPSEEWSKRERNAFFDGDDNERDLFLDVIWQPIGEVYALRVKGFAMAPTFKNGDIIIIDTGRAAEKGDFVVAKVDKRATPMLARYLPKGLDEKQFPAFALEFENQSGSYPPIDVTAEQPGHVIGTVREHRRFFRQS